MTAYQRSRALDVSRLARPHQHHDESFPNSHPPGALVKETPVLTQGMMMGKTSYCRISLTAKLKANRLRTRPIRLSPVMMMMMMMMVLMQMWIALWLTDWMTRHLRRFWLCWHWQRYPAFQKFCSLLSPLHKAQGSHACRKVPDFPATSRPWKVLESEKTG